MNRNRCDATPGSGHREAKQAPANASRAAEIRSFFFPPTLLPLFPLFRGSHVRTPPEFGRAWRVRGRLKKSGHVQPNLSDSLTAMRANPITAQEQEPPPKHPQTPPPPPQRSSPLLGQCTHAPPWPACPLRAPPKTPLRPLRPRPGPQGTVGSTRAPTPALAKPSGGSLATTSKSTPLLW